jgi:hypothetical protein
VHGQGSPTQAVALSDQHTHTHMMLPRVACALCGQRLQAQWQTGATVDDRYIAVEVHHCSTEDVRVVNAEDLSDDELLAAVKARGLVVG